MTEAEPHEPAPHDPAPHDGELLAEIRRGLGARAKTLPCKLFYDAAGSRLFERICELDEYYLTRTELAIMERHVADMAACLGPRVRLVEPGAGNAVKTRLLLRHLREPVAYVPIDISRQYLLGTARDLAREFQHLSVQPLCADYTRDVVLPPAPAGVAATVVYYPGSSIGNFEPPDAAVFLRRLARMSDPGAAILVGVDLNKDPDTLIRAYDDAAGVTAAFNLNMLARINREFGGDFDTGAFTHRAVYEAEPSRIVMQLVSDRDQVAHVAGRAYRFARGEVVTTEYTHKPSLADFAAVARDAGLRVDRVWTDARGWFSVQLLRGR